MEVTEGVELKSLFKGWTFKLGDVNEKLANHGFKLTLIVEDSGPKEGELVNVLLEPITRRGEA